MGKVRYRTLMLFAVVLCIMMENYFYAIPGLSLLSGIYYKYISYIYIVLALVCYSNRHIKRTIAPYCKSVNRFLIIIYGIVIVESIYTIYFSDLTFWEVLSNASIYLKFLLVYPILYILIMYGTEKINKRFAIVLGCMVLYCAYIAIVFNSTGTNLNSILIYNERRLRGNSIRIQSIALLWLIVPILFNSALFTKSIIKKMVLGVLSISSLLYFIFINQSRANYTAMIAMTVAMYIFKERRQGKQIATIIIVAVCGLLFLNSKTFTDFLYTFSVNYESNTTAERFVIIADLNNAVKAMPLGYLFGIGIRNTVEIGGTVRWFMDIGFLGDLFNIGILAVAIYGYMLYRIIKTIKHIKSINHVETNFLIGIATYLLVGMIGCTLLPYSRIFSLAFILGYCEFFENKYRRLKRGQNEGR